MKVSSSTSSANSRLANRTAADIQSGPGLKPREISRRSSNIVSRYGWGPRSERLVDAAPFGHWRTTTFIAGLRSTRVTAPLVLDGPMTGAAFRAYVE
jgi:hypothetical protein